MWTLNVRLGPRPFKWAVAICLLLTTASCKRTTTPSTSTPSPLTDPAKQRSTKALPMTGNAKLVSYASVKAHWAEAKQELQLQFSLPVDGHVLQKHCAYVAPSIRVAATLAPENQRRIETTLHVVPQTALAANQLWKFHCDAALPAHGVYAKLTKPIEVMFHTYEPFQWVKSSDTQNARDPEEPDLEITFNNPIGEKNAEFIEITPDVDRFAENTWRSSYHTLRITSELTPATTYTVTLTENFEDAFGQKLGKPITLQFRTGNAKPRVSIETGAWVVDPTRGHYPFWTRNVTMMQQQVAPLTPDQFLKLAPQLNWWDDDAIDLAKLKIAAQQQLLTVASPLNQWKQSQLVAQPNPLGLYYMALRAPETETRTGTNNNAVYREVLVNYTDLGVVAKWSVSSGLVWVTHISTGKPVSNATVTIRRKSGAVAWQGTTDAHGLAMLPGTATLLPKKHKGDATHPDDEQSEEDDNWGGGNDENADLMIFVNQGNDWTYLNPRRYGALSPYMYNVDFLQSDQVERLRGYVHTDRGLYRPGETVHLRGLARVMRLGEGLSIPTQSRVDVKILNPLDRPLLQTTATLSRFGGFHMDVPLPNDARLGDYRIQATLPQGVITQSFSVQAYRTAAFEVKTEPKKKTYIAGETLKLRVSGRYFYGAPLRAGKVQLHVMQRPRYPQFDAWTGYVFSDQRSLYERNDNAPHDEFVNDDVGTLDENGQLHWQLPIKKQDFQTNVDYVVKAEVQDESHQAIVARTAVPIDRSAIHYGIRLPARMLRSGQSQVVEVVAVDSTGKGVATTTSIQAYRVDYQCKWTASGYRGRYVCDEKRIPVSNATLALNASAPTPWKFTPKTSGFYWVTAEGKDRAGRKNTSAESLWIWGSGDASWKEDDLHKIDLVSDKPIYRVGDTAKLLVKTSMKAAEGVLTLEREGVRKVTHFTFRPGSIIEVPIEEGHVPNIYASVLLATPTRMKMGLINLPVENQHRQLQVTITPQRRNYQPGETVQATISVKNQQGQPVAAEVAVAAADEGVLSLINYKTPNPHHVFYAPWALGVQSTTQYERIAQLPPPDQQRPTEGGDVAGPPGTLRANMMSTAYWNPAVVTDTNGQANIEFTAPDNLTAYRLMAIAADSGEQFGSSDARITVSKPVQLLAALPRFLNLGDQIQGGVLVQNNTAQRGTVTLQARSSGGVYGGGKQTISLPAHGRVAVNFPIRAIKMVPAQLSFVAQFTGEKNSMATDGLKVSLPVQHPAPLEYALLASGRTENAATIALKAPAGISYAATDTAVLTISADPLGLAGIEQNLASLIRYPYGCLEQTTSQLIPLLMVDQLAQLLSIVQLENKTALARYIEIGLQKIGRHQNSADGGFSLWPGGASDTYLTAYALWGLHLAKQQGYRVDIDRVQDGQRYLKRTLQQSIPSQQVTEQSNRAFAYYVLSLTKQLDPQMALLFKDKAAQLPRYAQAFYLRALASVVGTNDPTVIDLQQKLIAEIQQSTDGGAWVAEHKGTTIGDYFSSDLRSTAIVFDTLLALQPKHPLVAKFVQRLVHEQRQNNLWNTQETLYTLVGLTHYAQVYRLKRPYSAAIKLNDKVVLNARFTAKRSTPAVINLPFHSADSKLTISLSGGQQLFYRATLSYRRTLDQQKAKNDGYALSYAYLDPDTNKPLAKIPVGRLVRLRIGIQPDASYHHNAVTVRLPAGLEWVNTRLGSDLFAELYDDRLDYFPGYLSAQKETVDVMARATTIGKYVIPAATAEAMYQPHKRGTTAMGNFEVTK